MKARLILLLTLDAGVQRSVDEALHGSSAVVLVARNLRDAFRILAAKGEVLDFAIVDLDQEFSGIKLLSALGAYRDKVAVIVIAGNAKYAELVSTGREGITFLEKPLPAEVLAAALIYPPLRQPRSSVAY